MKKAIHISTRLDQPELLNSMVEKLAWKRYDRWNDEPLMVGNEKLINSSSTETYVSGTIQIGPAGEIPAASIPFITCFMFTCVKDTAEGYRIAWSQSLS